MGGIARIFLYDATTNSITQVTTDALWPSISADGTRIVFVRYGRLGADDEIGLYDAITGGVQVALTGAGGTFDDRSLSLNAAGTRIAFTSAANLTGGNPYHEDQVFLYDVVTDNLKQITYATSYAPSISADGTRIFFLSSADHTGSTNLTDEVFLATCLPTTGTVPPAGVRVYPISAYSDLSSFSYQGWLDPSSLNSVYFDTFGKVNQEFELGLGTSVTGNVTVRGLGDGLQQVVIQAQTTAGICWGDKTNAEYEEVPAFGYAPWDLFGQPAAVGRQTLRITQRPQPVGPIRRNWPTQSIIGNLTCDGALREGSGYPEGAPGFAQTTQTGLFNTGVPTGCPREHDADCFPAEQIQFRPRESPNQR
jgi:hypothetical protein